MNLIFATANAHKTSEVSQILGAGFFLKSLKDLGYDKDIVEDGSTMEENALIKARTIYKLYKTPVFSDDSGLEIFSLDMRPGLISARYAGPQRSDEDNIDKVLEELKLIENRKARFRSVIALIIDGEEMTFEGIVDGTITHSRRGDDGFGYDPIFVPQGYDQTFAELSDDVKNKISHRYDALHKMKTFLQERRVDT